LMTSYQRSRARSAMPTVQTPKGEFWAIYDPDLGYRLNPKFGAINADGLRDYPIGPKNGRFRILFLGDSVIYYGDTIDDTVVGHLRANLRSSSKLASPDIDIINAGVRGYTNFQEILYLKKFGLKFEPDLVAIQFCLNDLHRFLHSFRLENGQIVPGTYQFSTEAIKQSQSWREWWIQQSYLLRAVENSLPIAVKTLLWKIDDGFSFDYAVDFSSAWRDAPWSDIGKQLEEFVQLGKRYHFKPFVVVFPIAKQYNAAYLARDRDYVLKPQRKLREICEQLGIPFYDLYPEMQADLFSRDGLHLTPEGRKVIGKRIANFLSNSGLLPAKGSDA
jgi:lysophospholipase L1-like esterase